MQNPPSWVQSYIPDSSEMAPFLQKIALTPQHGLVSKSMDPLWHITCWVTDLHFNACRDWTDIQFHTLFLLPFCFHLLFVFHIHLLHYFLVCFFLSVFPYFFLLSSFYAAIILCVFFPNFFRYSLSFAVCYLFFSTSLYFLPYICLYLSIYYFVLSVFWHSVSAFLY